MCGTPGVQPLPVRAPSIAYQKPLLELQAVCHCACIGLLPAICYSATVLLSTSDTWQQLTRDRKEDIDPRARASKGRAVTWQHTRLHACCISAHHHPAAGAGVLDRHKARLNRDYTFRSSLRRSSSPRAATSGSESSSDIEA